MRNLLMLVMLGIGVFLTSCNSKQPAKEVAYEGHRIEVQEVLQANAYTYLLGKENKEEYWIAVPKMVAEVGDVLYYKNGMEMTNFQSKDLDRVFPSVYFVEKVSSEPTPKASAMDNPHAEKPKAAKKEVSVEPAEGGLSLGELFSNVNDYSEKTVVVKGEVVKANMAIMNKNWYHIQDGTEGNGKFDLTVTTMAADIKVGDVVTFEGKLSLDKDFGHGYKYDVIMEDAVVK